ncbi:MAG: tyrosine--tRNA ligase [Chloroflexota bacterium]|nr:tyrosine--tRNA ligase [Chloroflexota bacterium]
MADRAAAVEQFLSHRVTQVVERDALRTMLLEADRPLRAKIGFDPTSPDLHIGHGVLLERIRAWQQLGNHAILVVGDTTAQIGDPSERNVTRPILTPEQVRSNAETYLAQFYAVVDAQRTEIRWQSEWFDSFRLGDVFRLLSSTTLARLIERDTFARRLATGSAISMHETLYPFLQAFDSVAVAADVEMGGTDQTFNLLVGRDVQRDYGQPPQQILTCELLVGTDGVQKMSKSLGNAIGLTEPPYDQYAKVMSIPDRLMDNWAHLVTRWTDAQAQDFLAAIESGALHAKAAKQQLAREVVGRWHGEEAARLAEDEWERSVGRGEGIAEVPVVSMRVDPEGIELPELLVQAGLASSRGEVRRLLRQGGVRIDGSVARDELQRFAPGGVVEVRIGKRRAARLVLEPVASA